MFDENFTVIPVICHFDWDIRFGGDMYQNYSWELIFILGVLIGCAATALYFQRKMLEDRVSELEKQNEKIRAANKNRLPFQTAEEIEHATAAFLLLQNELDFKKSLMDNLGAHLLKARENKRVEP